MSAFPDAPRLATAAQVRELDRAAIERGVPSAVLMENASRACADVAQALLEDRGDSPAVCLCGPGNNGGDGLAIARTLRNRGRAARAVLVGELDEDRASADLRLQLALWRGAGEPLTEVRSLADLPALAPALDGAALVVDALFGTGLARPLGEPFAAVLRAADGLGAPVLAVDLPSGLHADTGEALGPAPHCAETVTFAALKPGLLEGVGPLHVGRVRVAEIGIPRDLLADLPTAPEGWDHPSLR